MHHYAIELFIVVYWKMRSAKYTAAVSLKSLQLNILNEYDTVIAASALWYITV